jgi:hypothetical protein
MYADILHEMQSRIEEKEKTYVELKRQRHAELQDLAREVDLMMDRRRNRKARIKQNV